MTNNIYNTLLLLLAFLPFILLVFIDAKINLKKNIRNKQFFMPIFALVYCIAVFLFMNRLNNIFTGFVEKIPLLIGSFFDKLISFGLSIGEDIVKAINDKINYLFNKLNITYVTLIVFNTVSMLAYVIVKRIVLLFFMSQKRNSSLSNQLVSVFYDHDEKTDFWYIKKHFGQAKTFLKTAFYAVSVISLLATVASFYLCRASLIRTPFYPVFAIIIIGELAFFIDGYEYDELTSEFAADIDRSRHVTNYVILRKRLAELFGDKLTSEGTTANDSILRGGSVDQILSEIEEEYGRTGKNYAMFIRHKAKEGLETNADYVRSGIELAMGKSLLFNTPFYYKLSPYAFYAMHTTLLKGKKALIVLGRHGTTDDVLTWCEEGLFEATNLPSLWSIKELDKTEADCDIGIVTRSGVHDLELHRMNKDFLNEVGFVVLIEPSRLVTTAQLGLNLLVRNISVSNNAVYCSVDKNCDGLVDALSHILMTNITEVSATEFPQGISSYMCWNADSDYLQHRITPGISRYLGMGTEISFTALKNHVERAIWYGGDAFPVLDEHWIAKQYYHKLLSTTPLPATQETFDKFFKVSFNLCNEKVRENSFITVEDEFNNLFEVKREFSTMSRNQGFVNVISSDYLMRGYMTENEEIFNADPKAIPYISADYARTRRNVILKMCLKMSIHGMTKEELIREFLLNGISVNEKELRNTVWKEICDVFCTNETDAIVVETPDGKKVFTIDVIEYKREFSTDTGRFEDIYAINSYSFKQYVIDDLQIASYIAERGNESTFLGSELKGHILQKYLPGQFITLSGKYYEMLYVAKDNQVIIRRASDHINGRFEYRQTRKYRLDNAYDNEEMGMLKIINGIRIFNQFGDFVVDTPSYWRLNSYNDFENGTMVQINNVPQRKYFKKHILKLDFSDYKETFTSEVRAAITLMMNEVFKTLFAENQPYIVAVTPGEFDKPLTYSLSGDAVCDDCIYVIEDSQLDIGLLVSVERNLERIMHIVSDYLSWNSTLFDKPAEEPAEPVTDATESSEEQTPEEEKGSKKKGGFFKRLFGKKKEKSEKKRFGKKNKKKKKGAEDSSSDTDEVKDPSVDTETVETEEKPKKKGLFGRFKKKDKKDKKNKKEKKNSDPEAEETVETEAETTEEPAEEAAEETVAEAAEEIAEEATEETVDEATEETAEEIAEEPAEEIAEETVEETVDEATEETVDEATEETVDEATEETAEEIAEEAAVETSEDISEEISEAADDEDSEEKEVESDVSEL